MRSKLSMLKLAKQLSDAFQACKAIRYPIDIDLVYYLSGLYKNGGTEILYEIGKKGSLFADKIEDIEKAVIEKAVIKIAVEFPMYGQVNAAKELEKRDMPISSHKIASIWKKNGLETCEKRLRTLALYILTVKV